MGDIARISYCLRAPDGSILATNQTADGWPKYVNLGGDFDLEGISRGLCGMRVGDVRQVHIPYSMAFDRLVLPKLPAYSDLDLTVKLLDRQTPSGLPYRDLQVGTGLALKPGMNVRVRFVAKRVNGTLIDEANTKSPVVFQVGAESEWTYRTLGMRVGGKRLIRTFEPVVAGSRFEKDFEALVTATVVDATWPARH